MSKPSKIGLSEGVNFDLFGISVETFKNQQLTPQVMICSYTIVGTRQNGVKISKNRWTTLLLVSLICTVPFLPQDEIPILDFGKGYNDQILVCTHEMTLTTNKL